MSSSLAKILTVTALGAAAAQDFSSTSIISDGNSIVIEQIEFEEAGLLDLMSEIPNMKVEADEVFEPMYADDIVDGDDYVPNQVEADEVFEPMYADDIVDGDDYVPDQVEADEVFEPMYADDVVDDIYDEVEPELYDEQDPEYEQREPELQVPESGTVEKSDEQSMMGRFWDMISDSWNSRPKTKLELADDYKPTLKTAMLGHQGENPMAPGFVGSPNDYTSVTQTVCLGLTDDCSKNCKSSSLPTNKCIKGGESTFFTMTCGSDGSTFTQTQYSDSACSQQTHQVPGTCDQCYKTQNPLEHVKFTCEQ